jgi:mannitol/fructose-specific phosphotransferase system IIA component (Ntr-type)
MLLTEVLREDLVKVGLEAKDKWEAIEELVDLLISVHELSLMDRNDVVDAVFERERSLSTGLEHGVAIPHAVTGCVDELVGALGTLDGIEFESVDGQDTKLIILLLIPQGAFQRHVKTLAGIAKLGSAPQLRQQVFDAQTPAQIMEILRQSDIIQGKG